MIDVHKVINEHLKEHLEELQTLWKRYLKGHYSDLYEHGVDFCYVTEEMARSRTGEKGGGRPYFLYLLVWWAPMNEGFRFYVDEKSILRKPYRPYKIEFFIMDEEEAVKELKGKDYELLADIFEAFDEAGRVDRKFKMALGIKD